MDASAVQDGRELLERRARAEAVSACPARLVFAGLAFIAGGVATYLGLYQLHVVEHVWEPLFGSGSREILRESWLSQLLPVPDALLGGGVYLVEGCLALVGGRRRALTRPRLVLIEAVLAVGLLLAGLGLAAAQPLLFGAGCTLCLVVTACSLVLVLLVRREALVAFGQWRARRA